MSQILSRQDEEQLIEEFYRAYVSGAASDEEELWLAQELLEKMENGAVVTDDGRLLYIESPDVPVDADYLVDREKQKTGKQKLMEWAPFLLLGLFAAYYFVFNILLPKEKPTPVPTSTAVAVVIPATQTRTPDSTTLIAGTATSTPVREATPTNTPAPTLTPSPTPTPTTTPSPLPPEEIEVKPVPVELDPGAVVPVSLEIGGRFYPVVPTGLREDAWAYLPDPDRASWLAGSYVNVVLGLPYTQANLDLMAVTLAVSDTLTLRNSVGGVNPYTVVSRQQVGVYEIEAFGQRRAGLTLVLLGGNDEGPDRRLLVQAIPAGADGREEVVTTQEGN